MYLINTSKNITNHVLLSRFHSSHHNLSYRPKPNLVLINHQPRSKNKEQFIVVVIVWFTAMYTD